MWQQGGFGGPPPLLSLPNPAVAAPARAAQRRATGSVPQRYWLSVSTAHFLYFHLPYTRAGARWVGGSPALQRCAYAPRLLRRGVCVRANGKG